MDNRTEDQKRLERLENEVLMLREMVLTLLSPYNQELYSAKIQKRSFNPELMQMRAGAPMPSK